MEHIMKNSIILKNLRMYEDDYSLTTLERLVINDGKIVYMGNNVENCTEDYIDCRGAVLSRAFCDYHCHLPGAELYNMWGYNLSDCGSLDDIAAVFASRTYSSDVVKAFGWSIDVLKKSFANSNQTPLEFLDSVFPDKAAVVFSMDFHSCWCNSKALRDLKEAGIEGSFRNGDIPNGEECILHEDVAEKIFLLEKFCFSEDEIEKAFLSIQEKLLSCGITEVNTMMFIGISYWRGLEVLKEMDKKGILKLKINYAYTVAPTEDVSSVHGAVKKSLAYSSEKLSLTALKIYMDGVVDNHSAHLEQPYCDSAACGSDIWTSEQLNAFVDCAAELGLPIHVHAIGDAAVRFSADALARRANQAKERHIIAHVQLCSQKTMRVMAENNIVACLQPFWFYRGKGALQLDVQRLGSRVNKQYPAATLVSSGVKIVFGSDFPVTEDFSPLTGIKLACMQDGSGESLSACEAYRAFCVGSYADKSLRLTVGEDATFIILDGDVCKEPNAKLLNTYVDGVQVL